MIKPDPKVNAGYGISFYLFLLLIEQVFLTACTSRVDCASPELICAGLVTDAGGIDDHGLNRGAWEGLQDAISEDTLHYAEYLESTDTLDYSKNIEFFTERKFDIILTVGPGQRHETLQAAEENPAIQFVGIAQIYPETRSNLHAIQFQETHLGYLAGIAAAMLTKTGVVGAVCESSGFDSIRQNCEGFRLAASNCGEFCGLRPNQKIEVTVRYRNGGDPDLIFNDPEWGEMVSKEMIHEGADVIYAIGGGTGEGAIRAAADEGVWAIGAEKDQWSTLPEARGILLTSIYGDSRRAVQEWFRLFRIRGQPVILDAPFICAPFHDLESSDSSGMDQAVERIRLDLENGNLKIPYFP